MRESRQGLKKENGHACSGSASVGGWAGAGESVLGRVGGGAARGANAERHAGLAPGAATGGGRAVLLVAGGDGCDLAAPEARERAAAHARRARAAPPPRLGAEGNPPPTGGGFLERVGVSLMRSCVHAFKGSDVQGRAVS